MTCIILGYLLGPLIVLLTAAACGPAQKKAVSTVSDNLVMLEGSYTLRYVDSAAELRIAVYNPTGYELATTASSLYWTDAGSTYYSLQGNSIAAEVIYLDRNDSSSIYQVVDFASMGVPKYQMHKIGVLDSLIIYLPVPPEVLLPDAVGRREFIFISLPVLDLTLVEQMGYKVCDRVDSVRLRLASTTKRYGVRRTYHYQGEECTITRRVDSIDAEHLRDMIVGRVEITR